MAVTFRDRIDKIGIPNQSQVTPDFGYWFSGLFDGEGSLQFQMRNGLDGAGHGNRWYSLKATILMRADNNECLEYVHQTLGVGSLYKDMSYLVETRPGTKPRSVWQCFALRSICEVMLPVFDRYGLEQRRKPNTHSGGKRRSCCTETQEPETATAQEGTRLQPKSFRGC